MKRENVSGLNKLCGYFDSIWCFPKKCPISDKRWVLNRQQPTFQLLLRSLKILFQMFLEEVTWSTPKGARNELMMSTQTLKKSDWPCSPLSSFAGALWQVILINAIVIQFSVNKSLHFDFSQILLKLNDFVEVFLLGLPSKKNHSHLRSRFSFSHCPQP